MSAPAVVITLRIEAAPLVLVDALDESEADRLLDWIYHSPDLAALVGMALDLMDEAKAA